MVAIMIGLRVGMSPKLSPSIARSSVRFFFVRSVVRPSPRVSNASSVSCVLSRSAVADPRLSRHGLGSREGRRRDQEVVEGARRVSEGREDRQLGHRQLPELSPDSLTDGDVAIAPVPGDVIHLVLRHLDGEGLDDGDLVVVDDVDAAGEVIVRARARGYDARLAAGDEAPRPDRRLQVREDPLAGARHLGNQPQDADAGLLELPGHHVLPDLVRGQPLGLEDGHRRFEACRVLDGRDVVQVRRELVELLGRADVGEDVLVQGDLVDADADRTGVPLQAGRARVGRSRDQRRCDCGDRPREEPTARGRRSRIVRDVLADLGRSGKLVANDGSVVLRRGGPGFDGREGRDGDGGDDEEDTEKPRRGIVGLCGTHGFEKGLRRGVLRCSEARGIFGRKNGWKMKRFSNRKASN
mmetsp:Transcript_16427/g.38024  ORF Transcript_16427/g.38024 Transcript_16427/m.38024 type:complete len:411 (+) Transcript_16427:376-1608(+)